MNSRVPFSTRAKLEVTYSKPETVWLEMPRLSDILRPIWQGVVSVLAPLDGPRIKQIEDPHGGLTYMTYDPVTGSRHRFDSEEALRVWLERRYRG